MSEKKLNPTEMYLFDRRKRIAANKKNKTLLKASANFVLEGVKANYSLTFMWLGRPIIQIPQDMFAMQEIIWSVRPDYIIETGIAHGGSIIYYASILELMGNGRVIGIDIDIRDFNRTEINKHPMSKRIDLIQGSSVSSEVIEKVGKMVAGSKSVLVCLDSNHTHEHVLKELELYTPFISRGGYCVVFDTGIQDLPKTMVTDRPWGVGNNPKTAVWEFLKRNKRFVIDKDIDAHLLISAAPDGYLRCIKDYR